MHLYLISCGIRTKQTGNKLKQHARALRKIRARTPNIKHMQQREIFASHYCKDQTRNNSMSWSFPRSEKGNRNSNYLIKRRSPCKYSRQQDYLRPNYVSKATADPEGAHASKILYKTAKSSFFFFCYFPHPLRSTTRNLT